MTILWLAMALAVLLTALWIRVELFLDEDRGGR